MSVKCYRLVGGGSVYALNVDIPCGNINTTNPVVPCCHSGDTCLSNGFCSYSPNVPGGSGYYVADCTDSSGICPGFEYRCTDEIHPGAVWNPTDQVWQCCGADSSGNPTCEAPTNDHFSAPAPSLLLPYFTALPAGFSAVANTTIASTSATTSTLTSSLMSSSNTALATSTSTTASTTSSPTPSQGTSATSSPTVLSTGAKAGIGAGVGLAALASLVLAGFFIYRRRKSAKQTMQESTSRSQVDQGQGPAMNELEDSNMGPAEIAHDRPAAEMESVLHKPVRHELDAAMKTIFPR